MHSDKISAIWDEEILGTVKSMSYYLKAMENFLRHIGEKLHIKSNSIMYSDKNSAIWDEEVLGTLKLLRNIWYCKIIKEILGTVK